MKNFFFFFLKSHLSKCNKEFYKISKVFKYPSQNKISYLMKLTSGASSFEIISKQKWHLSGCQTIVPSGKLVAHHAWGLQVSWQHVSVRSALHASREHLVCKRNKLISNLSFRMKCCRGQRHKSQKIFKLYSLWDYLNRIAVHDGESKINLKS